MVQYIAQPILKIDGQAVDADLIEDILQISVEESLHKPAMFTLVISNSAFAGRSQDTLWKHGDTFSIGTPITIGFASSTTTSSEFEEANQGNVFQGEVTALEAHFTSESQAPMVIRGYDVSHRLHRGRHNRSFQDMTDSDIVNQVISEVGVSAGTVSSTNVTHAYIFQKNQTNMEFLRERAARNGFELFVKDGKLYFREPSSDETVELKWLTNLHGFRVRVSSAEQVKSVEVRGWDYTQKKAIVSTKSSETVLTTTDYGTGSDTSSSFQDKPSSPKVIVVDQPIASSTEADKIAQALLNELGGEFVYADAKAEGNPQIRPGCLVKLSDMGNYSGSYYVTETRHSYSRRVYTTEFTVRGLRSGDLLSMLAPPVHLQPGQTPMVGIVTNNKDPEGMGRIRVKFPTLTEDHESNWARVVSIGAGASRGIDWLPEVDDEVLVAFEHGDIHRPYIIGGVWNGSDKPPEQVNNSVADSGVRLRTIKTRAGHILQFVEEDKDSSKKGIYINTIDGHKLQLNDSQKIIEVKTNGGHSIRLDDQDKKIEVKTSGGHQLILNDNATAKIELTSTGDINIKAGSTNKINLDANEITLSAANKISLKAGSSKVEVSVSGVKAEGPQATLKGTAQAKVEGALVNVEGSGITTVKGSLLKLN